MLSQSLSRSAGCSGSNRTLSIPAVASASSVLLGPSPASSHTRSGTSANRSMAATSSSSPCFLFIEPEYISTRCSGPKPSSRR